MVTIDLQPTLSEGEVTLRPLKASDWEGIYSVASDPLIWELHPARDRWREPVFRVFFEDALRSGGALAITRSATGEILGSSRFDRTRAENGEIEVGWTFLARSEWGGQTNFTAKRLMVRHALRHFQKVIFMIGEHNLRSRRAVEKIGASLTSRVVDVEMEGANVLHVVYSIDRQGLSSGPLQG
ncbi:GNAT family N-acetyltransferase [Sphingomonas sp.]|jgi:RimJ/RimL family protein N-acetyltransferase|uniref:GNAT family N-acetyltransferase n=1 Tax=Sphingomonas sp. TaxID=28214 RepID=UPI002DE5D68D|nr:GNAT family N-acetyltransferase [Sphingomonas sp.]